MPISVHYHSNIVTFPAVSSAVHYYLDALLPITSITLDAFCCFHVKIDMQVFIIFCINLVKTLFLTAVSVFEINTPISQRLLLLALNYCQLFGSKEYLPVA